MPRRFSRIDRIAEGIQHTLNDTLLRSLRDPRLPKLMTVTAVKITRDLAYAKIYVSALADDQEAMEMISVLNKAAGFLRTKLAERIQLRVMPQLTFIYDNTFNTAKRLEDILAADQRPPVEPSSDDATDEHG